MVRTEQGTGPPLPTAGTQGPQLPFLTHFSWPAPRMWPHCPLPLWSWGLERAGYLFPPPCLKLGRGALRTGPQPGSCGLFPHTEEVSNNLSLWTQDPSSTHAEAEASWPKVRVGGGPGNTACGGCSLAYVSIKSDRENHRGCVCTCVNERGASLIICKQEGWFWLSDDRQQRGGSGKAGTEVMQGGERET